MTHHPRTAATPAPYAALLLALSVLLSLVLPAGAAWATAATTTTVTAADEDCAALPLSPFGEQGSAVGTATIPVNGSACFTFTADAAGLHRVLLDNAHNQTYSEVFDGDTQLDCYDSVWGAGWCELPRAGEFTLKVVNNGFDTVEAPVAVIPLGTTANCAPQTGTAWDSALVEGSATGPLAIQCQPFTGKAGERITVDFTTEDYGDHLYWITDGTGAHICPRWNEDGSEGCVLPGDGPYRVLTRVSYVEDGFPAAYTLKIRRLSDPAGCTSVPVNAYNSAPTTADPASGCKIFTAPAAGRYDVYGIQSSAIRSPLPVYDLAGHSVCVSGASCSLPAGGDYAVFTDYPTLVLDRAATTGCEAAELGTYQGGFAVGGEIDCLTLPLPQGARMAALTALSEPGPHPDITVVDADGVERCGESALSAGTCELTGKAPFRALVSTDDDDSPTGAYSIALYRTDAAADAASGCAVMPAGDFSAASASSGFSTGDGVFAHCLSIPATDHSAVETLQLQAVSGSSTAQFSVVDVDGKQACSAGPTLFTWTTCRLTPGVAHTVLVTGRDTAATYTLIRRDVTATAKGCTANPATAVGGPSTGGDLGVPGALLCRQVTTADAADTLHLNVRDPLGTANIVAFGADGAVACGNTNKSCAVTGSTSYQVLVTVPTRLTAAASYRFDALRIATADGPAAECAKVPNISYGYGPVTGTLDEQHTAICAALPTAYSDRFDLTISDTAGGTQTAVPALYDPSLGNGCTLVISSTTYYQCYVSEPYTSAVTPSVFVLGLPENASRTAYSAELTCTYVRCGTEQVTVGPVTPTTGVSGTKATVQVTGTALHKDDKVRISRAGGSTALESTTVSVSPDRKTLTATLDLTGAAADTWDLSVVTHNGVQYPRGTFTVTPAPLTNSTAPTIKGTPKVGVKLTADTGAWTPAPTSYTYQWKANGAPVSGATAATYTVPAALLGKKLTLTVTAHRAGYTDGTATTAPVTIAKGAAPKCTKLPAISGRAKVGSTLKAAHGTWTPAPTSYTYQWYANGKAISGATKSSLKLKTAQRGKKITVKVTALRTGHANGAATSKATSKVTG